MTKANEGTTKASVIIEDIVDHLCMIETTDGAEYLGIINCEVSSDQDQIEYALQIWDGKKIDRGFYRKWVKDFNLGELKSYQLQGQMGFKVSPLTADEHQTFREILYNLRKAKRCTFLHMENEFLDRFETGQQ